MTKITAIDYAGELASTISFAESYIAHIGRKLEDLPLFGCDLERGEIEGVLQASRSRLRDNRTLLVQLHDLIASMPDDDHIEALAV